MAQLCPKMSDVARRVVTLRRYFRILWNRTFPSNPRPFPHHVPTPPDHDHHHNHDPEDGLHLSHLKPSDLVSMKISLVGDSLIGKTSFLRKYVGSGKKERNDVDGLSYVDKIQSVQGAHLIFRICEEGGDVDLQNNLAVACKDSVAILIMFDLTSRRTLASTVRWYQEARKWNQTAIPVLIGTKFDEFVQLPMDLQWTIASEARQYAKAINATLFFSSSSYNINVNKVFKFITAKLFNLAWNVERNLTIGEPIIDF